MPDIPLYQGEQHRSPQTNIQSIAAPMIEGQGAQVNRAIDGAMQAVNSYARLKDYATQQDEQRRYAENQAAFEEEFRAKSNLPWGSEGAIYAADGRLNDDAIQTLISKHQEANNKIESHYWLRDNQLQSDEGRLTRNGNLELSAIALAGEQEMKNIRRAFEGNYDLAMARQDYGSASQSIRDAVSNGLLTQSEGQARLHRLAKSSARSRMAGRRSGGGRGRTAARQGARQNNLDLYSALVSGDDTSSTVEQGERRKESPILTEGGLSTHTLPSEDIRADSGQLTLPTSLPDGVPQKEPLLDVGYDEELFYQDGITQLADDEYRAQIMESAAMANSPTLTRETATGEQHLSIPESTPEPLEETMARANVPEGLTTEKMRQMAIKVTNYYASSPDYENLDNGDISKLVMSQMNIEGASETLFDGDDAQLQNLLEGAIQPVLSLRGGEKLREDRAMTGAEGLKGINQLADDVFDSDSWLGGWRYRQDMLTDETNWGEWSHKNENVKQSFIRNRARFNAETGNKYETIDDAYDDYFKWYNKDGGRWEEERNERRAQIKEIAKLEAIEDVAKYRANGGRSWAEEQRIIRQALIRASGKEHSQETPVADYYAQLKERKREQAAKYWKDAEATIQSLRARKKKPEPKQEQPKKTTAQLKEEERKEFPYRYPVKQSMAWDKNRDDTSSEPIITVPIEQYAEICEQLGITEDNGRGLGAKIDGGRSFYIVRPGQVSGVQISEALFTKLTPKGLTKSQLRKRLANYEAELTYQSF